MEKHDIKYPDNAKTDYQKNDWLQSRKSNFLV